MLNWTFSNQGICEVKTLKAAQYSSPCGSVKYLGVEGIQDLSIYIYIISFLLILLSYFAIYVGTD